MKTVFSSSSEVCHVWASRSQEAGRAGNVSFRGNTIYSYDWWPMARFLPDKNIVLMRSWSYSNSTSSHLNYVRRAIPDNYEVISVYNPDENAVQENIDNFTGRIEGFYKDFQTAKKYKQWHQSGEISTRKELKRYCRLFKCEYPAKDIKKYSLNTKQANIEVEKQQARLDELKAIQEVKYQKRLTEIEPMRKKALKAWLSGESNQTSDYDKILKSYIYISDSAVLRIKDDNIQTSMGANVPVKDAQRIWKLIQAGKSIKGLQIGHYTITSFNGELKVGCHKIGKEEVNRIGELLDKI